MVLCALISLPIIGLNPVFCFSLLIGTAISILNVCLMVLLTEIAVKNGNRFLPMLGMLLRVVIYAAAFLIALMQLGYPGGLGTAIGFLTVYIAIFYLNAVDIKLAKRRQRKAQETAASEKTR
jgi:ABC-type spermidine/putrescine transport system permease subunit II